MTREETLIREWAARNGYINMTELSTDVGMDYQTFRRRMREPGSMKLFEARALFGEVDTSPLERLAFIEGKEVEQCRKELLKWLQQQRCV